MFSRDTRDTRAHEHSPERLAVRERVERRLVGVGGVEGHGVAPPRLDGRQADRAVLRVVEREEDDDDGDGHAGVQTRGQDVCKTTHHIVSNCTRRRMREERENEGNRMRRQKRTVVLRPPRKMTPADDVVEDEARDGPGHVVRRRRRRDEARPAEDDRPVDVPDDAVRVLELDEVLHERAQEADEEEEHEPVVDLALAELPRGPDDAPDDRGRAEDLGGGADEAVGLVGGAHVLDVGEHPGLHAELDGAGDDGRDDLAPEHGARAAGIKIRET